MIGRTDRHPRRAAARTRPGGIRTGALLLGLIALPQFAGLRTAAAENGGVHRGLDPDSALVAVLRDLRGEPLRLENAIELALRNATGLREAEASLDAARGALVRERGAFDPEIFADLNASSAETPSSSPFARPDVIETETSSGSAGARVLLPFGTEIEASLEAQRIDTNSEFTAIDPEYRAGGRLEIRQPLLKGLGAGTSAPKSAAERSRDAAAAAYTDARRLTRARVEAGYWALHAAERDLAVQRLIVERAEALLEQARLKSEAGLVGPNEVANARVFLASQRLVALDQEERLDGISDQLASLMGTRPVHGPRFHAADDPPASFPLEPVDALLRRGLERNAQLEAAEKSLAALEARARGARRNAYPDLDLVGSLGGSGLAGTAREVVFGTDTLRVNADGGYGEAVDQAIGGDYPNWSLGLELSLPVPLREGRGESERQHAEVRRARHQVEALRRSLEERIRAAHRELANSRERLGLAREGVAASFEQVRIGLIQYDNGRVTAFEIVRLGADLASAQQQLSKALVRSAAAAAELTYLTGEVSVPPGEEARD
jgi:outer membrane protein TolC